MPRFLLLLLLVVSIFQVPPCSAKKLEKSFDIGMAVESNKWIGARLKNLNAGTLLKIDVQIDGNANVLLLNSKNYANFPSVAIKPLFSARVKKERYISVEIPKSGHYYLIIDNREGKQKLSFKAQLRASLELSANQILAAKKRGNLINQQLATLGASLKKVFMFDQLDIKIVKCGKPNAYSNKTTVFLCSEYIKQLREKFNDKTKIQHILMFALMHEVGHILLRQWDYPFYDNEEVADEFACALLIMFKQRKIIETQRSAFANISSDVEYLVKQKKDSRHPLSIQRARNLKRWLSSPSLLNKWQPIFIPHMQTNFLQFIIKKSPKWANINLTTRELNER